MNLEKLNIKKENKDAKKNNFNLFLKKLDSISCKDDNSDFGYSFDKSLKEEANNFIDLKEPAQFNENLILLEKTETFYENLLRSESYNKERENVPKYAISQFISENLIKANEEDSNALLSIYLKSIAGLEAPKGYNGPNFGGRIIHALVAPGRHATLYTYNNPYENSKITRTENKNKVNELLIKRDEVYLSLKNLEEQAKKDFNIELTEGSDILLQFLDKNLEKEKIDVIKKYTSLYKKYWKLYDELDHVPSEDLNLQEFFYNKKDKKDAEILSNFLIKIWCNPTLEKSIKDNIGISITDFSIPEQVYIMDFLKNAKNNDLPKIKEFSEKYKENGFKTFLSIEHGGKDMGDKILTLGEKLPEDSANVLFKTYSDMVDSTEEVGALLNKNLREKATPELINKTKESLLIAGKNLLEKYSKKASTCEGVACETLGKELKEQLSLAKKSVFVFSYACKTLVENGQFSFEDFEKVKLAYERSPLAEDIKNQIIEMHKENTKQYPAKLKEKWRETLQKGLTESNDKQLVVYVSYEKDVVSAMRVIEQEDGSFYGASFNVNPNVMGSKVGSELLKKVLFDLARDKPFIADCYSKNPMLDTYLNKFGFKITKEIENYEDTGELVYQITLFPNQKEV